MSVDAPPPAPVSPQPPVSPSTSNGVHDNAHPPPHQPSPTNTQPAPRTFQEYLHDHFDLVFKRVTMGRRDLKAIKSYMENRAESEKAYAKAANKDANIPDLLDSSSLSNVWKDIKESAIQTGGSHAQLGALCSELAASLDKIIKEIKQSKTALETRYKRLVADQAAKQKAHDKARDGYGEAVRACENAITQRDAGRNLPAPKQQNLENKLTQSMTALNNKHEDYKKAVHALRESQANYDSAIVEMMIAFESLETSRMQATAALLVRFAQQHEVLSQSLGQIATNLHRSCEQVNVPRDIQEFINVTTTHTKPRPHVEYHAIESSIIESFRRGRSEGIPSSGVAPPGPVHTVPGMVAPPQAGPPMNTPPVSVPPGGNVAVGGVGIKYPAPVTDRFIPPPQPAVLTAVALYDFDSVEPDDLPFKTGDVLVLRQYDESEDWWTGEINGRTGIFPKTYVQKRTGLEEAAPGAPVAPVAPVAVVAPPIVVGESSSNHHVDPVPEPPAPAPVAAPSDEGVAAP